MRCDHPRLFMSVLVLFSLVACLCFSPEALARSRVEDRGSICEALGEEFPELVVQWSGSALLGGLAPLIYWTTWSALGEEFPERASGRPSGEALGEEFPEWNAGTSAEALGEEFPE
jgi:hypothetical protein